MRLKGLERRWRRVWVALLARVLRGGRRARAAAPHADDDPRRVLFLRPDRIGDMIVSTGLIRAIARAQPTMRLDVLASPANAPVLRDDPHVAGVLVLDRRRPWRWPGLVRRLRGAHYDAVVDCMPTAASVTTLLLMLAAGARERVGVAGRGIDPALTIAVPPRRGARHMVEHLSALGAAFGVDVEATDFAPEIALAPDELARAESIWCAAAADGRAPRRRRLLVNVSAGTAPRRWPEASFVAVLRGVRARHPSVQILVLGAPHEAERAAGIAAHAGGLPVARAPRMRDALALVAAADVVLTPDTSIAHAACAFRKPVVDLLLRGRSAGWGPYRTPGYGLESLDGTLASLPAAPVLAALLDVIRAAEPLAEPDVATAPDSAASRTRVPARAGPSAGIETRA